MILAIGARPCSGAIMILLFSNALGIVTWGIAAVMTMAVGTALSIMGLSLAVRYARNSTATFWWQRRSVKQGGSAIENGGWRGVNTVCRGAVFNCDPGQCERGLYCGRVLITIRMALPPSAHRRASR